MSQFPPSSPVSHGLELADSRGDIDWNIQSKKAISAAVDTSSFKYPTPNPSSSLGNSSPQRADSHSVSFDSPLKHRGAQSTGSLKNTPIKRVLFQLPVADKPISLASPFQEHPSSSVSKPQVTFSAPRYTRLNIPKNKLFTIGRSSKISSFQISSSNKQISRNHVRLLRTNEKLTIECLGVNGINLTIPTKMKVKELKKNLYKLCPLSSSIENETNDLFTKDHDTHEDSTSIFIIKNEKLILPLINDLLIDLRGEIILLDIAEDDETDDELPVLLNENVLDLEELPTAEEPAVEATTVTTQDEKKQEIETVSLESKTVEEEQIAKELTQTEAVEKLNEKSVVSEQSLQQDETMERPEDMSMPETEVEVAEPIVNIKEIEMNESSEPTESDLIAPVHVEVEAPVEIPTEDIMETPIEVTIHNATDEAMETATEDIVESSTENIVESPTEEVMGAPIHTELPAVESTPIEPESSMEVVNSKTIEDRAVHQAETQIIASSPIATTSESTDVFTDIEVKKELVEASKKAEIIHSEERGSSMEPTFKIHSDAVQKHTVNKPHKKAILKETNKRSKSEEPTSSKRPKLESKPKLDPTTMEHFEESSKILINHLAFSRLSSTPITFLLSISHNFSTLSKNDLREMLDNIPSIGVIYRKGKDAAGKPLDEEYYYMPENDPDTERTGLVASIRGGGGLRSCRRTHKQYFWKKPAKK